MWYVIVRAAFATGAVTIIGPVWIYSFLARSEVFGSVDVPLPIVAVIDGAALLAGGVIARTSMVSPRPTRRAVIASPEPSRLPTGKAANR